MGVIGPSGVMYQSKALDKLEGTESQTDLVRETTESDGRDVALLKYKSI
jgi:hypothetical protein